MSMREMSHTLSAHDTCKIVEKTKLMNNIHGSWSKKMKNMIVHFKNILIKKSQVLKNVLPMLKWSIENTFGNKE